MRGHDFIKLVRTAGAVDGAGYQREQVSAIVRLSTAKPADDIELLALGSADEVAAHPAAAHAQPIDLPHCVLIPGLVNAHAHLDLTHLGPMPFDAEDGFVGWIGMILRARNELATPVPEAVRQGIECSLAGGVVAIGDVSGTPVAAQTLRDSPLRGVGFLEVFGLGARAGGAWAQAEHALHSLGAVGDARVRKRKRISVQPHAPYSAGRLVYEQAAAWCAAHDMPLMTHWSETPTELEFVAQATGPMRAFLENLGLAGDGALDEFGAGETPIEHVADAVCNARVIAAHVNAASDGDIERLATLNATVAYCPRASAYFEHDIMLGPHRYREMLNAGINVALGTDSIVCHPAEHANRLSTLDDARLLFDRDAIDPGTLLAMATVRGARALGLEEALFRFPAAGSGVMAGLNAVDVRGAAGSLGERLMRSSAPCMPLRTCLA